MRLLTAWPPNASTAYLYARMSEHESGGSMSRHPNVSVSTNCICASRCVLCSRTASWWSCKEARACAYQLARAQRAVRRGGTPRFCRESRSVSSHKSASAELQVIRLVYVTQLVAIPRVTATKQVLPATARAVRIKRRVPWRSTTTTSPPPRRRRGSRRRRLQSRRPRRRRRRHRGRRGHRRRRQQSRRSRRRRRRHRGGEGPADGGSNPKVMTAAPTAPPRSMPC